MTIYQVIPEFTGTRPDKDTQTAEVFDTNMQDWVDYEDTLAPAINTWKTQANNTKDDINQGVTDAQTQVGLAEEQVSLAAAQADAAEEAKLVAMAAANFKGNWEDQAGAASIPYSVWDVDAYWMLVNDLADVTASRPGDTSSDWQKIEAIRTVRVPTATSPVTGDTNVSATPELIATGYANIYNTDVRDYRIFEIDVQAGDFSAPVYTFSGDTDTHVVAAALDLLTGYKWRCRDVAVSGAMSKWMWEQTFSTADVYIDKPTNIAPSDTESDIGETPILTSDAFSCVNGSDTHASSDWEIYDDNVPSALVYSSYDDASNLTTLTVPEGVLEVNATYNWRVRHTGTTYGDSEWSTATSFTTKASFALIYGIAQVTTGGTAGSWARVDADGNNLTLITTDFDNHPVWGGMVTETIDGQVMVKVPKFYFKVGTAPVGSDRAGKKCWWISDAPVTGFALYPAFMDTGVEINQFWMGAYEASDDAGTSVKSVAGVAPLASVSFDGFVTRIAARNTGGVDGFHMPDIHELGAVQMLALIEMGTPDAQSAISVGNDTGAVQNTGVAADVYRGIYQLWSNVLMWVDGLRTTTAGTIKIYDDQGNQTWVVIDTGLSANRSGWPVTMKEDVGTGYDLTGLFIADTLDATEINGTYADMQYLYKPTTEDFVCRHGGYWTGYAGFGLFYVSVGDTSSYTNAHYGARLAKR
jgi:hypothetical protein